MGSFEIFLDGKIIHNRAFGRQISEFVFKDLDGIDVISSLNTDEKGNLYEIRYLESRLYIFKEN